VTDAPRAAASQTVAGSPLPVAKPGATIGQAAEAGFSPSPSASPSAAASFALRSSAFASNAALPADFSCDGTGQSPPLMWSGAPAGTRAYALVEEDADTPTSAEWVLYNMPLVVNQLDAGIQPRPLLQNGAQQGTNSHQTIGYYGACPNKGDPPHHYTFMLFAQDDYITMETGASAAEVKTALTGHVIAQAQLVATFQR
jgi:Raf kinase inhibitor-like YbhB/YbcL family protein